VAASNGLGEAWIAAADARGRFTFAGLAPGGWQIRAGRPPLGERELLQPSGVSSSVREMRFDVEVQAGRTANAVLDLASPPEHVLQGRILLDGAGLAGARVELHPGDLSGRADDHSLASCAVAEDGAFELRLRSGGPVVLSIHGKEGLTVLQPLDLPPGISPWELDVQSASVVVSGSLPKASGDRSTMYLWRLRAAGGACVFKRGLSKETPGEPLRVKPVPAGQVDLLFAPFPEGIARGYLDDSIWTVIASVRLEPGRETALALP
jgi:hypothetical protein